MKPRTLLCRFAPRMLVAGAVVVAVGCPAGKTAAPAKSTDKHRPLTVLVVDDEAMGKAIAREWRARTEDELTVQNASLADISKATRLPGDAVVLPSGSIGQLAEHGLILPIEPAALEDPELDYRDIFDQVRLIEAKWGNRTLACPLGSPQLVLAYRGDVFDKLGIDPPEDWAQYQAALKRLADRESLGDLAPAAGQTWRATTEPLAGGWAGQLLLARAAAYALHREQVSSLFRFDSMEPLIDRAPFVRALDELVAAAKQGGFASIKLSPTEAFGELREGRCGMAIGWPAPEVTEATHANDKHIRFCLLPGARQAYRFATKAWEQRGADEAIHVPLLSTSGRMAAVCSGTTDPRRAQSLVLWLSGRDVSQQVGPHSRQTTLFRTSHIKASERWTGSLPLDVSRQYADVLSQTLTAQRALPGVTLPGRQEYLDALDQAVAQAIDGKPAAAALKDAAARWREITERLGADAQRRANARSLGQQDL